MLATCFYACVFAPVSECVCVSVCVHVCACVCMRVCVCLSMCPHYSFACTEWLPSCLCCSIPRCQLWLPVAQDPVISSRFVVRVSPRIVSTCSCCCFLPGWTQPMGQELSRYLFGRIVRDMLMFPGSSGGGMAFALAGSNR